MAATRRDTPFREAMRSLLVFDGAMGSLLYERGIFVMWQRCRARISTFGMHSYPSR